MAFLDEAAMARRPLSLRGEPLAVTLLISPAVTSIHPSSPDRNPLLGVALPSPGPLACSGARVAAPVHP